MGGMIIDGKPKYTRKPYPTATLFTTYPMDCTGREPGPPQSELGISMLLQLTSVPLQKRNKEK
jgi:hypothetical protein